MAQFRKPFRAAPVRLGPYARRQQKRRRRARLRRDGGFIGLVLAASVGMFAWVWTTTGTAADHPRRAPDQRDRPVWYPNCATARAAGAAPIERWERGYRPELDRDGDGVACEPYRGGDAFVNQGSGQRRSQLNGLHRAAILSRDYLFGDRTWIA